MLTWPDLTFGPINLWSIPPHFYEIAIMDDNEIEQYIREKSLAVPCVTLTDTRENTAVHTG